MKKPRLLNLAAAVSLLLAVAIIVLWVRSHQWREGIARFWHTSTEQCILDLSLGYNSLDLDIERDPDEGAARDTYYVFRRGTQIQSEDRSLGDWFLVPPVRFHDYSAPGAFNTERQLSIAYWLLLLPTLPLPAVAIVRHRRRRRRARGNLCPACGYDLRAHRPGDRCPECGAAVP